MFAESQPVISKLVIFLALAIPGGSVFAMTNEVGVPIKR